MNILLYGLNYSPEEIGIGKYSGEMVEFLAAQGHHVTVVTSPPYYPHWKVGQGYKSWAYKTELGETTEGSITINRCPLWVPQNASGAKRILHLASFALSSFPVVLWKAIRKRYDIVMTVEPAAFCMPATLIASTVSGAKSWLHVQDFEIDAAFELGILKQPLLKRLVLAAEGFLMRRFKKVSSISPNMVFKLIQKGVSENDATLLPNWVDCEVMKPLDDSVETGGDFIRSTVPSAIAGTSNALRIDAAEPPMTNATTSITEIRRQFGLPSDRCIAMYAGNIGAKQGLEIIIETARMHADRDDLCFVICGTGASHEQLLKQSAGIKNLHWLPVQPLSRFNELMNCADIHLLPQRAGAADLVMPSKLTGMLATGRPIVACAAPGTQIADVVSGKGLVVAPDDTQAFAEAVVRLAESEDERIEFGRAGRRYAVNHLSRSAVLSRFERELQQLAGFQSELTLVSPKFEEPNQTRERQSRVRTTSIGQDSNPSTASRVVS